MLPDERITDLYSRLDTARARIEGLKGEVAYEQERNENNVSVADLQLADSAEAHTEKDMAIKSLTDSNLELARERDEGLHCAEQSVNSGILLNDQYERAIAQLTEANALLREAEAEIDGMLTTVIESGCFNNGIFKPTQDLRCRLAAHLNPKSAGKDGD